MTWTFGTGLIYPGSEAVRKLKEQKERPAIISDDGVTIMRAKTVPEAGLLTLVYQKGDIERIFYMELII